jgi:tetratricopeptide (TPR) repeat protein
VKQSGSRTKSRAGLWLALFVVAAVLGAGVWWWTQARGPQPPAVDTSSLDPALAHLIGTNRAAVLRDRRSGAAWGILGQALHTAEFQAAAVLCYSNATVLAPQEFRWWYLRGLLELQDAPQNAVQHLERATELARGVTDAPRYQLARALVERGRYQEALPHLRLLLSANPNHAAGRVELARVHLATGALREATEELQPALTNSFTMRPALFIAAQIARRTGQVELSGQLSKRATGMPRPFDWPDPVLRDVQNLRVDRATLADQANSLLQSRRYAEAGAVLQNYLQRFPDDPEGLLLLGRFHYVQRQCGEAENAYRRHLGIEPDSLNGLIQLGLALLCQQQWTNAAAVLERAISLKPDFAQAHFNLGLARSRAGDSAGAIAALRDALRCTPGDVNIHLTLADELGLAGQFDAAREHVLRAAEINPGDPRVKAAQEQLQRLGQESTGNK